MPNKVNISLAGGLFAGVAASLCCVGPLLLLLLGFGGAWVGNLTALEPYRPIFIGIAFVSLAIAYLNIYRTVSGRECEQGKVCAKPPAKRWYKDLFWGVVVVVLASIASPYLISLIYG
jgi:mercuric ion transport protein